MSYKTLKRRLQRKKAVFVKVKRKRWLEEIREEAFQEWKTMWESNINNPFSRKLRI